MSIQIKLWHPQWPNSQVIIVLSMPFIISFFKDNPLKARQTIFPKLNFDNFFFSLPLMYIENMNTEYIDHLFVSLSNERSCIRRGVNFVFFSFFSFSCRRTTSSCRQCVTFFWQSIGVRFSSFCLLPSVSLDQWPRKEREREVSHVIVLSSSFSVNGRRRKKWVDGEWTSFPFLFFFYLKVSSNTLPLCKTKKRRFATSLLLHPSFSMIKDKQ